MFEFKQEPFLNNFCFTTNTIQVCEEKQKKESKKIKNQNAKLINNAMVGNSKENTINKVDVKGFATRKPYLQWSLRPTFKKTIL